MIYQLSLTFQKDREIYTPTKKKRMYMAVYCGSALYSVILKCVVEEIIIVSIKSPPFIALHKKRKILKFWAGRGGKCPFSTPLTPPLETMHVLRLQPPCINSKGSMVLIDLYSNAKLRYLHH